MCAFGKEEAKAVLNDVVEHVSVKKGVKRAVEDLTDKETNKFDQNSAQINCTELTLSENRIVAYL